MPEPAARLRFLLGLKLRRARAERGWTLKEVAERAGLSVSYLSEIEKGKKYPAPAKLFELAAALGTPFDELVSLRVGDELAPVQEILGSGLLEEFPLELFGVKAEDLLGLVTDAPDRVGALVRALLDVGRMYDLQVEHFLLAALRSYQQMHHNYFEELEQAAARLRDEQGWEAGPVRLADLRQLLETDHDLEIDDQTLGDHPDLGEFRSVFLAGPPARLLVNGRLLPCQQTFVLARELGFRRLELAERTHTSSWIQVESFEQVLNNFKASYFAGALLMPEASTLEALAGLFATPRWQADRFLGLLAQFDVTPEMLAYRLTQLAPRRLGLQELFFLRFTRQRAQARYRLTKVFNLSRAPVPHGLGLSEHYCRRWPAMRLLAGGEGLVGEEMAVGAQRSRFITEEAEFLVLSLARPLALRDDAVSAVSVGFLVDDALRDRARFLDDPAIPRVDVGLTCERCPLVAEACSERVAEPVLLRAEALQGRREAALKALRGFE